MKQKDMEDYIERYSKRYKQHGYSAMSLGWGKNGNQIYRFNILKEVGIGTESSVLDVGCGFGDFYGFLVDSGWHGEYVGLDIVEDLLMEARRQYSGIDVRNIDILDKGFSRKFDYVISSGIFNAKLTAEDNYTYINSMLKAMLDSAEIGVAADFLSIYVDYQAELNFHADPEKIYQIIRALSRRNVLRSDYMPYEFAVYLYRNDSADPDRHVFLEYKNRF